MSFDLERSVEILSRTPGVLRALLSDLSEEWTAINEGGESWSPFEVVGHLLHCENDDWIPRAHIILDGTVNFESFDRFAHLTLYRDKSVAELLDAFEAARERSLEELLRLDLSDEQLDLPGFHPDLGDVTLRQLLATWVVHDLGHLAQIERVMAKQYCEEIGPWKQHLPIVGAR